MKDKILLIIKRNTPTQHYEVHKEKTVEFWRLNGDKIGESTVEPYP